MVQIIDLKKLTKNEQQLLYVAYLLDNNDNEQAKNELEKIMTNL